MGFFPGNQKLLTVFIGTYMFMFIGCGSLYMENRGDLTLVGVAFAWSSVVMANIYTFGHISGAHINPALTFAFAVVGQFSWKHVPLYIAAELLGSFIACSTLKWLFDGKHSEVMLTRPVGPRPANDLKVVAIETIVTFMYTLVSSGARTDPRAIKELGGVAVGASVFFIVIFAGKITGASMNPARSLGPAIITSNYNKIWIYLVSPVMGAVAATLLYFLYISPQRSTGISNATESASFEMESRNPPFSMETQPSNLNTAQVYPEHFVEMV